MKNITLEFIINVLREKYPQIYFVYTSENTKQIIIRLHLTQSIFSALKINIQFGAPSALESVNELRLKLEETVLRGASGVLGTTTKTRSRTDFDSTTGEMKSVSESYIVTNGSNLADALCFTEIDPLTVYTDSVIETNAIFGIEAAKTKIKQSLKAIISSCNDAHLNIYSAEMTQTGFVTSVKRNGVSKRDNNALSQMAFGAPIVVLEKAAIKGRKNTIDGISASAIIGAVPKLGSYYSPVIINEHFVRENTSLSDWSDLGF
jgi:DNA-directed RNA polymerase beta' subunit